MLQDATPRYAATLYQLTFKKSANKNSARHRCLDGRPGITHTRRARTLYLTLALGHVHAYYPALADVVACAILNKLHSVGP